MGSFDHIYLRQIAAADVVLLNKVDLVQNEQLRRVEDTIQKINPAAAIHRTVRGEVDLSRVIGIGAYDSRSKHNLALGSEHDHNHEHGPECNHDSTHHYEVRGISSLQITCPVLDDTGIERLDAWIRSVLWENRLPDPAHSPSPRSTLDVLRCKGLFHTTSGDQYILQGVRSLYDLAKVLNVDESYGMPCMGKLVLIGKGLDETVRDSLVSWLS
jgi:G3E family GTPase